MTERPDVVRSVVDHVLIVGPLGRLAVAWDAVVLVEVTPDVARRRRGR